jgi:hypothetical protein
MAVAARLCVHCCLLFMSEISCGPFAGKRYRIVFAFGLANVIAIAIGLDQ